MKLTFDPAKRDKTLADRGLDFADAGEVCTGRTLDFPDERFHYGEVRFVSVGTLRGGMVIIVRTPRADACHIISMRTANEHEQSRYRQRLGQG